MSAQIKTGLDVINDGEMSKPSYVGYVAQRLAGFATFAALPLIDPQIAWAKLAALAEGARLASEML